MASSSDALCISPPQEVYRRTTSTSVDAFALPQKFHTSWISVTPYSQDCWVRFVVVSDQATDPSAVDSTTASTKTGDEVNPVTDAGYRLVAGVQAHFDLGEMVRANVGGRNGLRKDQYLWMLTKAAGSGTVEFYKSSGPK